MTIGEAKVFVERHHRHHAAPQGGLFALAINDGCEVVGVVVIGRPVARRLQDGYTAEVTRCCVLDETPNGCSMLYGAAWRVAREMGYNRLITYTLDSEPGISLQGAGWNYVGKRGGGNWNNAIRPRVDSAHQGQKKLWERSTDDE